MFALNCLNRRSFVACVTLFCLSFTTLPAKAAVIEQGYGYAAVAYSETTGEYGIAHNYSSLNGAKRAALADCPAADAEIVAWVQRGFIVLAIGEDLSYGTGWEYGDGASSQDALNTAVANCQSYGTRVKTIVQVYSGPKGPQIVNTGV
jgi:hypothetical protein